VLSDSAIIRYASELGQPNLVISLDDSVNNQLFIRLTIFVWTFIFTRMPGKKTSQSALGSSAAVEDYLERILELINSKGYARVVDIAAALKISQASVTNMIQRLDAEGLLKYEKYRGLILTAAGKSLARKIAHRHKLLTDFLTLLGLNERIIYHDVEGMEHHTSPPTLRAIEALTAQLRRRPALRAQLEEAVA
jgi:Mn-dependent DtxR family transcriptional regulator